MEKEYDMNITFKELMRTHLQRPTMVLWKMLRKNLTRRLKKFHQ